MRKYAVIILALMALGACELFRVRESNPPTKPPLWNNLTTSWELCMQNLQYCYNDARNVVNYGGLFTDNYRFQFAAQDINDYGITGGWTRNQEQDMLISLHGQCDSLQLELKTIDGQHDDISASQGIVYRTYRLLVYKKSGHTPELYAGQLELHFIKAGGYWYINKWYDYRSTTDPTWGKLKYDNAQ